MAQVADYLVRAERMTTQVDVRVALPLRPVDVSAYVLDRIVEVLGLRADGHTLSCAPVLGLYLAGP